LAGLFVAETGMTLGRWREHSRIVTAIDKLTAHNPDSPRAQLPEPERLHHMSSRVLGMSPGRYLKGGGIAPPSLEFE
jgi:hypothetical protein